MFTLRQLHYLVGIADNPSFQAAAERLGVSQPSLTQQMQVLQQTLGVTLFEQIGRRSVLTDIGRRFLIDARQILNMARESAEHAQALQRGLVGRIRVGCSDDFANSALRDRMLAFFGHREGLQLELYTGLSADLVEQVEQDQLDMALGSAGVPGSAALETHILERVPIVALVPVNHPFADRAILSTALLSTVSLILLPAHVESGFASRCRRMLAEAGISPPVTHSAASCELAGAMATAGLGIALGTATSVIRDDRLVSVALDSPLAWIDLAMITKKAPRMPSVQHLWDWMCRAGQGNGAMAEDLAAEIPVNR